MGSLTDVARISLASRRRYLLDCLFKRLVRLARADLAGGLNEPLELRFLIGEGWFAGWHGFYYLSPGG